MLIKNRTSIFLSILLFSLLSPLLTRASIPASLPLPLTTLFNLTAGQPENIAVRSNGQILVTSSAPTAIIWLIDPTKSLLPITLISLPATTGTFGIVESAVHEDLFYVVTGNLTFDGITLGTPSTYSIWSIDMRCFELASTGTVVKGPKTAKLAKLPEGALINSLGIVKPTPNRGEDILLGADSVNGLVWKIAIAEGKLKGEVGVAVKDDSMSVPVGGKGIGINGVKYQDGLLYYTNSMKSTFSSIAFDPHTALAVAGAKVHLIANMTVPDDFILSPKRTSAFVCSPALSVLSYLDVVSGEQQIVATGFAKVTAVAWGRNGMDKVRGTLYITQVDPTFGSGAVMRVDVSFV